jgi:hypothetical protein
MNAVFEIILFEQYSSNLIHEFQMPKESHR